MTTPAPLPFDAIEHLRVDGTEFVRLTSEVDPTLSIPSCPGWDVAALGFHVARAWNHWAGVIELGVTDRNELRDVPDLDAPSDRDELVDLLYGVHVRLCDALHGADDDDTVWTWTGRTQPIDWVARRMTHETMVHLWDLGAATGAEFEFPAVVAADGVDEWLTWFAAETRGEGEMKVGGTVHLHCIDEDLPDGLGEWYVASMKEPQATFTREHRTADAAIRGHAHDLLMWVWRRSTDGVEILGDEVVARRFRAFTDLT